MQIVIPQRFKLPMGRFLATDTETTGLFTRQGDRPFAVSFANLKGESSSIFFKVNPFDRTVTYRDDHIATMRSFFMDPENVAIAHNAQFDYKMICAMLGERTRCQWRCTMALIRLVKSSARLALKPFCKEFLGIPDDDEQELRKAVTKARLLGKKKGWKWVDDLERDYWMVPELCQRYVVRDSLRVVAVWNTLLPEVKALNLGPNWEREKKVWPILRDIEDRGVHVDRNKTVELRENFKKKQQLYTLKARVMAGPINLNSGPQLKKKFYDDLKLPVKYWTKKHHPATNYAALKAMDSPLAKAILEMRACGKTIEFMNQYLEFMVQHDDGHWYIHPEISQSIPTTGRESCYSPNLQQASSGESIKETEVKAEVRSVFTARPDHYLRSYDYKNIEVFIPGFKSGEERITQILLAGGDVHQNTADSIPVLRGTSGGRFMAKRVFFGLQYGMMPKLLSQLLNVAYRIAEEMWYGFQETYPVLWEWNEKLKAEGAVQGSIRTAYGRRQEIEPYYEYRALNYYVQGTAADILKEAKIKIKAAIKKAKLDSHMVLPIHDEILLETNASIPAHVVDDLVVRCMQDNPELEMPISIPVSISEIKHNWHEKTKVRVVA